MSGVENADQDSGSRMFALMRELWPICRSITGEGVRQTLRILQSRVPELEIHEVPTGTQCFDWKVPREWEIRDAYIAAPDGTRVVDFKRNNLHVMGYSTPVDREMTLEELQPHLYSLPEQPTAIPYITSYYAERWGFCLAHVDRERLRPGRYRVRIDSALKQGSLTFGEAMLAGETKEEILLSTYVCHPSMANNELSGPVVTAELAQWLARRPRRYSYRIVFVPETLGSICYLSTNLEVMKARTRAGFVLTCVGDERAWSFMPSREGDTLADAVGRHVLGHLTPGFTEYTFLQRGSDERQYCSPGVDLPVASIMRSKYGTYPEYHTSLDSLEFVTPRGLEGALVAYQRAMETLEGNCVPKGTILCEPQMSNRGLRSTVSTKRAAESGRAMMDLLAYADGRRSLLQIAHKIGEPAWELRRIADQLVELDLLRLESLP